MIYYFSKYWRIFQISQFARWNLFSRIYFRISMLFFHHHSMLSHFLLFFNFPKFFPAFPGFPWVLGTLNKQRKLLYVKNARWASATEKRVCIQIQVKTQRQTHTNINTHKNLIQTNTKKNNKIGYLYSGKRQTILNSFSLNFRISCFIQKKIFQQNTVLKVLEMSKYIKP